ncbi:MATH domain and coiled-coil domain-containing protein At2g42460 isoform X1 [Sesamum indicum]|uniref:MATH domain and coiled-coil domain-containing protein At2g42460 isoform X1 n=1 Tax=Sesamum indicum TaxID=4182 RepID=A0A6I9UQ11_SESIN|nr:MATH domain and coiled-coil domain-containing protein At2g42460 isoform X1 [Sesamum indicum]
MADLSLPGQDGLSRSISETPPNHYILKIQSFSQLTKHKIDRYNSTDFEAGGYKWKLVLHPNGNKNKGISDHISVYLLIAESNSLVLGWQIRAIFRLFLLDQNKDTYLTLQDIAENGRRFHQMKPEWGFDKFIPHSVFNDSANGYLVNDTCVFGAEVYVCQEKLIGKGECLSMIKDAITYKNTWRVEFSSLTDECVDSQPFNAADQKWKIQLYPRGKGSGAGSYISLYLTLAEPENLPPASRIYAEFTLRILDQLNRNHYFGTANYWFSASHSTCGWPRFVSHGYFNLPTAGLLVKNTCLVEAEVIVHGMANGL